MLQAAIVVILVLWAVGLLGAFTLGGYLNGLLFVALALAAVDLVRAFRAR